MEINGYLLLLQDFCEYCPDFEPEVESIVNSFTPDGTSRAMHNIRCINRKRCAGIAENIRKQVAYNGKD